MSQQFRVRKANYKDFMEQKYYLQYKWCGFWWDWGHSYGKHYFDTPEEAEEIFRKFKDREPPDETVSIHTIGDDK